MVVVFETKNQGTSVLLVVVVLNGLSLSWSCYRLVICFCSLFSRIEIWKSVCNILFVSYANQLTVDCMHGMQRGLMGRQFMGAFCETPLSVCIKGVLMKSIVMLFGLVYVPECAITDFSVQ